MLRYAITDRRMFAADEAARQSALLTQAKRLAGEGVDYLQLREKDLRREELIPLARELQSVLQTAAPAERAGGRTRLLLNCGALVPPEQLNSPRATSGVATLLLDVLAETAADGLHLPGGWSAATVLELRRSGIGRPLRPGAELSHPPSEGWRLLSAACHSAQECNAAARAGIDLILFSPVFGKISTEAVVAAAGLEQLRAAAAAAPPTPVLALGGVTGENAAACIAVGAAGVAGIRMFQ